MPVVGEASFSLPINLLLASGFWEGMRLDGSTLLVFYRVDLGKVGNDLLAPLKGGCEATAFVDGAFGVEFGGQFGAADDVDGATGLFERGQQLGA